MLERDKMICLFDIDGKINEKMKVIEKDVEKFMLNEVKKKCKVGLVGG
jgi:hypothetical protein